MKKVHFPNLDAWRFIAFFSVFLFHSLFSVDPAVSSNEGFLLLKWLFSQGNLGVNFFFVLSGFLITYLLLVEEADKGKYNIRDFWMRRILRIWPLYFAVLLYSFFVFRFLYTTLSGKPYIETADPVLYVLFLPNFNLIFNGFPLENSLTVLWSVGIEEQFYLLWPLLFFIRKARMLIMSVLIIACIIFRYFYADDPFILKYHTLSVMANLAFGCMLANITFLKKIQVKSLRLNKYLNAAIYLIGFCGVFLFAKYAKSPILLAVSPALISLFFCYIIFEQVFVTNSVFDLGKIRFFDYWGKFTYGLYCLHCIGIFIAYNISKLFHLQGSVIWVIFGETTIALLISLALAWLSYRLLEKPFLLFKNRFAVVVNKV